MADLEEESVRIIPHAGPRIETGAVQFGDDWPGIFIRGDNALYMAMVLRAVLSGKADALTLATANSIPKLLAQCDARLLSSSGATDHAK